jgi:hypothetical protein
MKSWISLTAICEYFQAAIVALLVSLFDFFLLRPFFLWGKRDENHPNIFWKCFGFQQPVRIIKSYYSCIQQLETLQHICISHAEEFEYTKGVIRIRKSKKNRQSNGQKKKYMRCTTGICYMLKSRTDLGGKFLSCIET